MSGTATSPNHFSFILAWLRALPIDCKVHRPLFVLHSALHVRSTTLLRQWRSRDHPPRRASVAVSLLPAQCAARWWQTRVLPDKTSSSSQDSPLLLPSWPPPIHLAQRAPAVCSPATLPIADNRQTLPRLRAHQDQEIGRA